MLPASWRLEADPALRRRDGGRVLLGGTPFRAWRLDARGAAVADRLLAGEAVGRDRAAQGLARRLLDAGMAHPVPTAGPGRAADGTDVTDVTVVVPFLGPADELAATLAALAASGHDGPVLVVDDGTPAAGAAAVAEVARRSGARLVRHEVNRGPAAARNTGWRRAETAVVAFLDGGCRPGPAWLPRLLAHLDDPQVAAVAPRITATRSPSLPAVLAAYEQARPSLDRGAVAGAVRPRGRVPFVPTAALVVRVADLVAAGGFDEDLRFGEDVDLVWRLVGEGRTVRYEPAATVAHVPRPDARSWLRQRFDYGGSAAPLAERHDDAVRPLGTSARVVAAWALGVGVGPVAGLAVAAATTVALVDKLPDVPGRRAEALRLSARGHGYAGLALVEALRRPWWPLLVAASVPSRRARRLAALVALAPPLVEWARERPPVDPVRWTALRLADDLAYGAGVWAGCRRQRSARALRPVLLR